MKVTAAEATEVAALLAGAARAEIMPRFRRLAAGEVRAKTSAFDLVTEADEAAERRIRAALQSRWPGIAVLGEEQASADPRALDVLVGEDAVFIVDPVDGTANFAGGVPLFGVMLALVVAGETRAAWIHDPLGQDTAIAIRGEGAWIEATDGTRTDCRVAAPVPVGRMLAGISWGHMPPALKARVLPNLGRLGATLNFRCSAHEYRLLCTGGAHALGYNLLMPWDHAGGALIHAESGGFAARFDGSAYSARTHGGGLLLAPDRASWEALREALALA